MRPALQQEALLQRAQLGRAAPTRASSPPSLAAPERAEPSPKPVAPQAPRLPRHPRVPPAQNTLSCLCRKGLVAAASSPSPWQLDTDGADSVRPENTLSRRVSKAPGDAGGREEQQDDPT